MRWGIYFIDFEWEGLMWGTLSWKRLVSVSLYSAQSRSPRPLHASSRNYCPAQTKQDQASHCKYYILCVLSPFLGIFSVHNFKSYQFGASVTVNYGDKDANRIEWGIAKLLAVTMVMKETQRVFRGPNQCQIISDPIFYAPRVLSITPQRGQSVKTPFDMEGESSPYCIVFCYLWNWYRTPITLINDYREIKR